MLASSNPDFVVPNGTFVVELVIFIVVLGVVAKFILPPFQRALDERERTIRERVSGSEAAHVEVARLDSERLAVLADARRLARSVLDDATGQSEELVAEARARARVEHDRMVEEAAGRIAAERERVSRELLVRAEPLVVAAAERIVGAELRMAPDHGLLAAELSADPETDGGGER